VRKINKKKNSKTESRAILCLLPGLVLLFLSWNVEVQAAPSISDVNDSAIEHGQELVISGSGFGTKSPAKPFWWDDMEGAADGSTSFTSSDLSWVTTRFGTGERHYAGVANTSGSYEPALLHYRAVNYNPAGTAVSGPHSYSTRYATGGHWQDADNNPCYDCHQQEEGYDAVCMSVCDPNDDKYTTWYASWYYRLTPEWDNVPYPNSVSEYDYINHKILNVESSYGWYTSGYYYMSYAGPHHPSETDSNDVTIQSTNASCNSYKNEIAGNNPKLRWVRYEYEFDSVDEIQEVFADGKKVFYYDEFRPDCDIPGPKQGFMFGGWFALNPNGEGINEDNRGSQKNWRFFDDLYVDTTFSRVVLANNSNYTNADIIEPQIPSAWSDSSITVTTNLGNLPADLNDVYLFVFDSDNNHNSPGYPLGSVSCPDLTGDISGDCVVNFVDVNIMAKDWLLSDCNSPSEPPVGPVGWWKFDDGTGSGAVDSGSGENDGTLQNMEPNNWIAGQINGALNFDGVDEYVQITDYKGILGTQPRTITAWVKTNTSGEQPIVNYGLPGDAGERWCFRIHESGMIRVEVTGGPNHLGTTNVLDNVWHHVGVVFTSGTTMEMQLYVDGQPDNTPEVGGSTVNTVSGADVTIGSRETNYFTGLIDEVQMYDYALTGAEIAYLAGAPAPYQPLESVANLYDEEPQGSKRVNLKDFSVLADDWLKD